VDPSGKKTTFVYNSYNQLISKHYPNATQESYSYHKDGTIATIKRVDGTSLHFTYDNNGNITTLTAYDQQKNQQEQLHYRYDSLGNLLEASTDKQRLTLHYNPKAQIIKESQNAHTIRRYFDQNGHTEKLLFLQAQIDYDYDAKGLLTGIKNHTTPAPITLKYTPNGAIRQRSYPNQTKTTYDYDPASDLTKLTHHLPNTQLETSYEREATGRVVTIQEADTSPRLYHYHPSGTLAGVETQDTSSIYTTNSAGNRTKVVHHTPQEDQEIDYSYNSANHLLESTTHRYKYDARGNLIAKQNRATQESVVYHFNLFDQLVYVTHYNAARQPISQYQYSYDALNRRISKTFVHAKDPTQSYTHHYLYDNQNIIAILDHQQNTLATITHSNQTDTPLSITNEQTAQTYYYHTDHQGSITHLSNHAGEVVETFTYDGSYGTILEHTKTQETYNPYCYTGREFDSHDLYYYRARYYDPTIGRFISQDPIEFLSGDFNWYRYVGNDPVNWVDPSGLAWQDIVLGGLKNFAGAVDSFTGGATGWAAEQINSAIYGKQAAQAATAQIRDSIGYKAVEYADYVNPKGWGKNSIKKVGKNKNKIAK
jgi:RHS repeat-associated protein